jgi:uncharacterized membrane protein
MDFSIKNAFLFGWSSTRNHFFEVLIVLGIFIGINASLRLLFDILGQASFSWQTIALALLTLVVIFFEVLVQIGVIKESLNLIRGGKFSLRNIFSYIGSLFKVFIAWTVYVVYILGLTGLALLPFLVVSAVTEFIFFRNIGFLFALVVCLYAIVTFSFSRLLVVDKDLGPIKALYTSEELTRDNRVQLFILFLLLGLLNMGGILLFFLGLILTIPVSFFALIWVYEQLLKKGLTAGQK